MNEKGLTLTELLVAVAIFATLAAISIPGFSSWLPNYRLKGSARDVYGVMGKAKSSAVRSNTVAVVIFSIPNDTYTVFLDNGPGAASGNWALDASETIIASGTMNNGIDMYGSTFPANTYGFSHRGLSQTPLTGPYEVYLKNSNGRYMGVRVNTAGCLTIISSTDGGTTWN